MAAGPRLRVNVELRVADRKREPDDHDRGDEQVEQAKDALARPRFALRERRGRGRRGGGGGGHEPHPLAKTSVPSVRRARMR